MKDAGGGMDFKASSSESVCIALEGGGQPLSNKTIYEANRTPRLSPAAYVRKECYVLPFSISGLSQFPCESKDDRLTSCVEW